MLLNWKRGTWLVVCICLALVMAGCPKKPKPSGGGHEHEDEGPHEGAIAEWGDHEYHAEFTVNHDTQTATIYVLDKDLKKAPQVAVDKITNVKVMIKNVDPPATIELTYDKTKDDGKGYPFVGKHPALKEVKEYEGVISGEIAGTPYKGEFKEEPHEH